MKAAIAVLAALLFWAAGTAVLCFALLRWGKGWTGPAHALPPAAIMAAAVTLTVALVVWAVAHVLGGQAANAAQAEPVLERYLERFIADGTLGRPRRVLGLTIRFSGSLRGVPIYLDFSATELRLGMSRYDLNALRSPFAITLLTMATQMPRGRSGGADDLVRRLETRFAPMTFVTLAGTLYLNRHVLITDAEGAVTIPAERLAEVLEAMVDGVSGLGAS